MPSGSPRIIFVYQEGMALKGYRLGSYPMMDRTIAQCRETGRLILQDSCYMLHRSDGARLWLEMDRIPLHLVEQDVTVEGERYGRNLIAVSSIGPLSKS